MENSAFIHTLELDKKGGCTAIPLENIDTKNLDDRLIWLHFNYKNQDSIEWIKTKSGIEQVAMDVLLKDEQRPRAVFLKNSIALYLKGINLNTKADEDMISIRVYISDNMIITAIKENVFSISDIKADLDNNMGPKTSIEFLLRLSKRVTSRMQSTIDDIEDQIDSLEEKIMRDINSNISSEISDIRMDVLGLKKYLIPQKEAINSLYANDKPSRFSDEDRVHFSEIGNQISKYIEELDTIKEKVFFIQEEFRNNLSEQMNNKIYILSIISSIFLPLGFLTGLLGINVGGIPGAENKSAFYMFVSILTVLVLIQLIVFKRKKWI